MPCALDPPRWNRQVLAAAALAAVAGATTVLAFLRPPPQQQQQRERSEVIKALDAEAQETTGRHWGLDSGASGGGRAR